MQVALLQMTAGLNVEANARTVVDALGQAAARGVHLVSTPEMTNFLAKSKAEAFARAMPEAQDLVVNSARDAAQDLKLWVHLGSVCVKLSETRVANRTIVINPHGEITARYDKIHMFDVDLGAGEVYRESALYQPGETAVVTDIQDTKLGLSICYDIRFASLYRHLAQAGAEILCIPAAFTQPTGEAHWETLLRARAIETGCFVIAAAQTGQHESGRKTHGNSLIIDPWGQVLGRLERQPGLLYGDVDLTLVGGARSRIPSLAHDRPFELSRG
ncbi:MAG: carbon-nitrogen hydrolase family protein [Pseudomonadota bacterium]